MQIGLKINSKCELKKSNLLFAQSFSKIPMYLKLHNWRQEIRSILPSYAISTQVFLQSLAWKNSFRVYYVPGKELVYKIDEATV